MTVYGDNEAENAASSAPAVYAAYCQMGGSGQGFDGGGAVVSSDPVCDHMKMADRMLVAYNQMREWCGVSHEDGTTHPACDYEMEKHFLEQYNYHLERADRIVAQGSYTGQVSKTAGQLVIPGALIYLLFLL